MCRIIAVLIALAFLLPATAAPVQAAGPVPDEPWVTGAEHGNPPVPLEVFFGLWDVPPWRFDPMFIPGTVHPAKGWHADPPGGK